MIGRIVVGVDSSALGLKALQKAISFAQSCDAELKLVHVLTERDPGAPQLTGGYLGGPLYPSISTTVIASYQTAWNQFVTHSQSLLDQQISAVKENGIQVSGVLLYGNPGEKLCEAAETWNADLMIVGSRGLAGISELLIGSVSNYVLHHAPCSVLVVHADKQLPDHGDISLRDNLTAEGPPKRILVALDKSDMAKKAMKVAIALAKTHQADIRLLHIIDDDEPGLPPKLIFSDSQYISQHSELLFAEYQQEWNKFVNGWWQCLQRYIDDIEAEGIEAICDVMQGRTGQRICEVAEDWSADLIVMGSRGFSRLQELLVGSVSYYVSHRASCAVLVTRSKPAKTQQPQTARQMVYTA